MKIANKKIYNSSGLIYNKIKKFWRRIRNGGFIQFDLLGKL